MVTEFNLSGSYPLIFDDHIKIVVWISKLAYFAMNLPNNVEWYGVLLKQALTILDIFGGETLSLILPDYQ